MTAAHKALSEQIADKKARRIYWALVYGNIKANDGVVDTLIGRDPRNRKKMAVLKAGGREAVTRYRILERYGNIPLWNANWKRGGLTRFAFI